MGTMLIKFYKLINLLLQFNVKEVCKQKSLRFHPTVGLINYTRWFNGLFMHRVFFVRMETISSLNFDKYKIIVVISSVTIRVLP